MADRLLITKALCTGVWGRPEVETFNEAGKSTSEGQENARMSGTSAGKYYDLSPILDCTCNMYAFTSVTVFCEINGTINI